RFVRGVKRGALLGILAVTKILKFRQADVEPPAVGRLRLAEIPRDRRVIGRSLLEHGDRATQPEVVGDIAALEWAKELAVERWIAKREHVTMILRRGAEHRWSADIDLLDCFGDRHPFFRDRRFKWIQIDDYQIHGRNRHALAVRDVLALPAVMKD